MESRPDKSGDTSAIRKRESERERGSERGREAKMGLEKEEERQR